MISAIVFVACLWLLFALAVALAGAGIGAATTIRRDTRRP